MPDTISMSAAADDERPLAVPHPEQEPDTRIVCRPVFLFLLLVVIMAAVFFSPLREYVTHVREISERIQNLGHWGAVVFVPATAALVIVGVPRLSLCPVAGMAFGLTRGILYSQLGTLLGYYVVFLFVRWTGASFLARYRRRLSGLTRLIHRQGIPMVILIRQLPIQGMLVNLALCLSPIRHRDFLIGSLIGLVPEAIPFTLIGCGALQPSFVRSVQYIGLAVILMAAVSMALKLFVRSHTNLLESAGEPAPSAPTAKKEAVG